MKKKYLFLSQNFVYPANKGEKIPIYQVISNLPKDSEIHYVSFNPNMPKKEHIEKMKELCTEVKIFIHPKWKKILRGGLAFLFNKSVSNNMYSSFYLRDYLKEKLHFENYDYFYIYGANLGTYFFSIKIPDHTKKIICLDDVDSVKYSYYSTQNFITKYLWKREEKLLFKHEKKLIETCDRTILINIREKLKLRNQEAKHGSHIGRIIKEKKLFIRRASVDLSYFDHNKNFDNPYKDNEKVVVFTGSMNYPPNEQAALWYAKNVFEDVHKKFNRARFYICGRNPTSRILSLQEKNKIIVTKEVSDIRPYLYHANLITIPIFYLLGFPNKLLEAMAMGKIILTTQAIYDSLDITLNWKPLISYNSADMVKKSIDILTRERLCDKNAISLVEGFYDQKTNSKELIKNIFV